MRKDQKLLNFRQEVGSTSSSRGRPARHISECFRTIAWYGNAPIPTGSQK